jgi:hypothetical protein
MPQFGLLPQRQDLRLLPSDEMGGEEKIEGGIRGWILAAVRGVISSE